MTILDTNILIEVLKNNPKTISQLSTVKTPLAISSITAMELIYGARNKQEVSRLEQFITKFDLIPLNANISAIALKLVTSYAKSHNLDIPDALIAATAIDKKLDLLTYNSRDFRFIKNLQLL